MAQIEREILERTEPTERAFKAPPFIPRVKNADLGLEKLDGERYFSPAFMKAEWDKIWTKTWQLAARIDEFTEPGAFYVHELGKESFIFVMGDDQQIRGFYNVCQHRGNRLCQSDLGIMDTFTCPFHGWKWNTDGTLKQVADPQFFRQFDAGIPTEDLGLTPVKVEFWGGWVWFNMDHDACPLQEYLGEAGVQLETYEFEKFHLVNYQTFEWNGNWKHAWDAFNESYHFGELHPDMIEFGEGHDIPIELLGVHSRMINFNRTVSEIVDDQDTITPLRQHMMLADQSEMINNQLVMQAEQTGVRRPFSGQVFAEYLASHYGGQAQLDLKIHTLLSRQQVLAGTQLDDASTYRLLGTVNGNPRPERREPAATPQNGEVPIAIPGATQ